MKRCDHWLVRSLAAWIWLAALLGPIGAPSQPVPWFTNPQRLTNAEVLVNLQAGTGVFYRLLVSTNLLSSTNPATGWDPWVTLQATGAWRYADAAAPMLPSRFYRAEELRGTNFVTGDHLATSEGDLVIHPGYHASFVMNWSNQVLMNWTNTAIYVDPTNAFAGLPRADLILLTHEHTDHLNTTILASVRRASGIIIAPQRAYNSLTAGLKAVTTVLANGGTTNVLGIGIEAVPAYNTNSAFHPRGYGNGYVLSLGGKRIYIGGDTDNTPEMRALTNIDAAFLPVNQPYTMTVTNAALAVRAFRPRVVYPYHSKGSDLERFKQMVGTDLGIEVRLRNWY